LWIRNQMRQRNLRILLTLSLLLVFAAAPALQALPSQRPAEALWQSPMVLFADWLALVADWLGWTDPMEQSAPRAVVAPDEEGGNPPPPANPTGDDGTCANPDGTPCRS
jgi:hypothetical protein